VLCSTGTILRRKGNGSDVKREVDSPTIQSEETRNPRPTLLPRGWGTLFDRCGSYAGHSPNFFNLLFEGSSDFCLNNATGVNVKVYNVTGYLIILAYMLACMYSAPAHLGPWIGMLIGAAYFVFCWVMGGLYVADVLHLGIAHRPLDYKEWFMKAVTAVNNTFAIYVDPIAWVKRHRLHHKHSDHPGDPNKLASDGFWRTLYLCVVPYECTENLGTDKILQSRSFRVVSSNYFAIFSQVFSFLLLWLVARDL